MQRNGPPYEGGPSEVRNDDAEQSSFCASSANKSTKIAATRSKQSTTKPNASRRQAKGRRVPTRSCQREVAVYNGQILLGIVKIARKATAYDPDGKRVGIFATLKAASDALEARADR
jgi:hypothetical protein